MHQCHLCTPLADVKHVADSAAMHVQTIAAVSPNAAKLITLGTPAYVQNAPFTLGATTTGIGASEQLFNVGPCLITFAEQGININPLLIQISPRLIQNDAIGIQIQPELITVDPTLINIGPNGMRPPGRYITETLHALSDGMPDFYDITSGSSCSAHHAAAPCQYCHACSHAMQPELHEKVKDGTCAAVRPGTCGMSEQSGCMPQDSTHRPQTYRPPPCSSTFPPLSRSSPTATRCPHTQPTSPSSPTPTHQLSPTSLERCCPETPILFDCLTAAQCMIYIPTCMPCGQATGCLLVMNMFCLLLHKGRLGDLPQEL